MKKSFCCFILFLLFFKVQAQLEHISNHSTTLIPLRSSKLEMEGSPYFGDEKFLAGKVVIEESETEILLRYNVAEERMEIKVSPEDEELYELTYSEKISYHLRETIFRVNKLSYEGKSFFGYFIEYFIGTELSFYGKPVVKFTEAVKAKTGYQSDEPARVDIYERYFFVFRDGRIEEVEPKTRVLKKIFDSQAALQYLKDNKVKSVEDLKNFAEFINTTLSK